MSSTSSKTNSILVALSGAVLIAGVALHLVGGGGTQNARSVYSSSGRGLSRAFELLHELEFDVRAWSGSPGQLPAGGNLLISQGVPAAPAHYSAASPDGDTAGAGSKLPETRGQLDPAHYGLFVERGGTLLLTAGDGVSEWLAEVFRLEVPDELVLEGDTEREPAPLARLGDVELKTSWNPDHRLVPLEGFEALLVDAEGAPLASQRAWGRGRLVLLADDGLLTNENLPLEGCAFTVVRLVEELAPTGAVLFDEYALGGWAPESPLDLAFGPSVFPFSLHIVLLLLAGIWIQAWVRVFPRDPERIEAVSAELRARGLAGLLAAAGRWTLLAGMLRRGVLRRLAARSGLRLESAGRVPARASGSVADPDEEEVRAALAPLLGGRERMALDQAVRIFTEPCANSREGLEALGRALVELERVTKESPAGARAEDH